jgi:hypothetical protein
MRARRPRLLPVWRRPGWSARGGSTALAIALAVALAACNASSVPTNGPTGSSDGSATESASPEGSSTDEPSSEPTDQPSSEPTESPTAEPTSEPTPSETAGGPTPPPAGGTGACTGTADTRDFFVAFAEAVSWPVYCGALPKGWSVEKGTYRLANGGRLTISYRRRADGARVVLDEGAVCAETNPCVPSGSDLGSTAFGDREADLSTITDGFAAAVDETENPAWLLTGTGLDRDDFTAIAAKLHLIDR